MTPNVVWGMVTVALCLCGYILAFKQEQQGKYSIAILLLMACGVLLRLYTATDVNLHAWDERYHALVAKHLIGHPLLPTLYENPLLPYDYKNFTIGSVWVHKQPLPLWFMALSLKVFGVHAWAVRIPSVILSTLGIKVMYDVAAYLYNKKIGFVTAFLFSIQGLIIELAAGRTATDHVDIAFMFFVLLGVWCGIKNVQKKSFKWALLVGVSIGCAILCKWLTALIVVPVWMLIFYKNNKSIKALAVNLLVILIAATATALPWQLYILHNYPAETLWELKYNSMHIHETLAAQGGSWFYHFNYLRMNFGELIYIPVICFTITVFRKRDLYDAAIFLWFWIPYLFFSYCATKMQAYTIFAAPAVFIITAYGYDLFKGLYKDKQKWRWLYAIIAYGLLLLPVRYCIERTKVFSNDYDRNPVWQRNIAAFKATPQNNAKTVVLKCPHYIEMMFETDCAAAYDFVPGDTAVAGLKAMGYDVVMWNKE